MSCAEERRTAFRVFRGTPSDAELAALIVVLTTVNAPATEPAAPEPVNHWSDRAARLRATLRPGPGAWRASAWPR